MKVLIADPGKASLVMTSEIFKDFFPGVQVLIAATSTDAIDLAKTRGPLDAVVVDFDLPDRNGAETAARIKKFSTVPVLITAFDREEVGETIEKAVAGYDDCLSWLKKPVKAELVVDIVRRFCEGKYRTKRRLSCAIPALVELFIQRKGKESETKIHRKTSVWVPAIMEDCSVGGIKLRIVRDVMESLDTAALAKQAEKSIKMGDFISVQLPSFDDISKAQTESWLDKFLVEVKETKPAPKKGGKKAAAVEDDEDYTLKVLKPTTQRTVDKEGSLGALVKGKIVWNKTDGDDLALGVESENAVLIKKLFDSVLESMNVVLPED